MPKFKVQYKDGKVYLDREKLKKRSLGFFAACRNIYISDKYVVKIDDYNESDPPEVHTQCKTEWQTWKKISNYDRRFFAKVYKYGRISVEGRKCGYIIQKRIKWVRSPYVSELQKAIDIAKKYNIDDIRSDNMRIDDKGRVRIIDFGLQDIDY